MKMKIMSDFDWGLGLIFMYFECVVLLGGDLGFEIDG